MGLSQREKGKRGERELASLLRSEGYDKAHRTSQYCGQTGEAADCVGLPGIHIECKRVEKLNVPDAMNKAATEAKQPDKPALFHRRDRQPWLVTMLFSDWIEIYREWEAGRC